MKDNINIFTSINAVKTIPTRLEIVIEILKVYNCRIQEILTARWSDFYEHQYLILRGAKNSRDIVVRDRFIVESVGKLHRVHSGIIFYPVSYYTVYHHIKSNLSHLFDKSFNRKNQKITHYYRYSNVSELSKRKDVSSVLNHGSKHSAHFYNKKAVE